MGEERAALGLPGPFAAYAAGTMTATHFAVILRAKMITLLQDVNDADTLQRSAVVAYARKLYRDPKTGTAAAFRTFLRSKGRLKRAWRESVALEGDLNQLHSGSRGRFAVLVSSGALLYSGWQLRGETLGQPMVLKRTGSREGSEK